MICPKCKYKETKVIDSRDTEEEKVIRRRRECEKCSYRFTTFERPANINLIIMKKDSSRENYDREKLKMGIWKACEKRPISDEIVEKMISELEERWVGQGKEISAKQIGEEVMDALKNLDEIAYIRFASVYRHFKDLETFQKELQKLLI